MTRCERSDTPDLVRFANDELEPDDAASVERHVNTCDDCQRSVAEYRRLREEAANVGKALVSPALWTGVSARIVNTVPGPRAPARHFAPYGIGALVAASMIGLLVVRSANAPVPHRRDALGEPPAKSVAAPIASRDTTFPISPILELDVNKASGRLTILAWDRAAIRIRVIGAVEDPYDVTISEHAISIGSRHASIPNRPAFTVDSSGTHISANVYRDLPDTHSEYEITIPRGMVSGIGGVGADVSISGTSGRTHAVVVNGRLSATDISGQTLLESLNGRVVVRNATGPLSIVAPSDSVTILNSTGLIDLRKPNPR